MGSDVTADVLSSSVLRLYLHEDGSVEPSSRDAHLQPARCDRRQEQPPLLHDPHWGSEEEYDHRSHCQVTGVCLIYSLNISPKTSDVTAKTLTGIHMICRW